MHLRPSSSMSTDPGRRVPHNKESCIRCRRRKIKCIIGDDNARLNEDEGMRGSCKPCLDQVVDCIWDTRMDGRRANAKGILFSRISFLENELNRAKAQYGDLLHYCNLPPDFTIPTAEPQSIEVNRLSTMLQHGLVLDGNGLRRYGGPSAYYLGPPTMENQVSPPVDARPPSPLPVSSAGNTVQWYRVLPMEKVPLSEEEHLELLDLFFNCFAFLGIRCHRDLFHRDMQAALSLSKTRNLSHYSPMLHNAVLAIATAYSDNPRLKNLDARMAFAKKAEEYMCEEIRNPTLSGVQAMSHLAAFYSGLGMRTAGSVMFAICASMTQSLGLGIDASDSVAAKIITEQEKHDRDWLFWVVFVQDKMGSLYLGRELLIPKPENVRIPELPQEKRKVKANLFKEQIRLFLIGADVFQKVYCRTSIRRDDMISLFDAAESWYKNLPIAMGLPDLPTSVVYREKIMLHLSFHWITLVLYSPFYKELQTSSTCVDWNGKAVASCDSAADQIVHLFEAYDNLRQIPLMAMHVAFSAGVVFIFQMERFATDPSQVQASFDKFTKCKSFLDQMAITWDCAAKNKKILESLCSQPPEVSLQSSFFPGSAPIPSQFLDNQMYQYFVQTPMAPGTVEPSIYNTSSGFNSGSFEESMPRSESAFNAPMGPNLAYAGEPSGHFSPFGPSFPPIMAYQSSPPLPELPFTSWFSNVNGFCPEDVPCVSPPISSGSGGAIRGMFNFARASHDSHPPTSHSPPGNVLPMQERMRRHSSGEWVDLAGDR